MVSLIAMPGEITSVLPAVVAFGTTPSLGALKGLLVDVVHAVSEPLNAVVQPAGSTGALAIKVLDGNRHEGSERERVGNRAETGGTILQRQRQRDGAAAGAAGGEV